MDPAALETLPTRVTSADLGLRARLYRLGKRAYWVGAAAAFALFAALPPGSTVGPRVGMLGVVACLVAMVSGLLAGAERFARATVSLRRDGLLLESADGAARTLHRDDLAEAYLRRTPTTWQLRVRTRAGVRHDIDLPDEQTAARWLRALGLDAADRAMRVVTDRAPLQWVFAYFFGSLFSAPIMLAMMLLMRLVGRDLMAGSSGLAFTYLAMLPGMWLAARSVGHVDVTVGVDGVRAGRGFRRRFVPLYAIARVDVEPGRPETLHVFTRDGAAHRYRFSTAADAFAAGRRIDDLVAQRDAGAPAEASRVLGLARDDTPEAWRDAFVDALRGGAYRDVVLTPDAVARVVTSPAVTPAQRLGAALALDAVQSTTSGTGVRIAEEAVVDPEAHAALRDAVVENRQGARRAR